MDFAPLALSGDDRLPADIQLILAYRGIIPPQRCAAAIEHGLRIFPHLTGRITGDLVTGAALITPGDGGFALEVEESTAMMNIRDLEALPLGEHSTTFVPHERKPASPGSLFQARLTLMPRAGLCVLGLRVSHAAVDGTGLAWFISHCTAALRGAEPPAVFHERRHGFGTCLDGPDEPPHGYRQAGSPLGGDAEARSIPTVFAIQADAVRGFFGGASILDARLRLAAWLCATRSADFSEVALWCDPRGTSGIPAGYTGNAGCYLHFPLRGMTVEELTRQIRGMATRRGFQRIADTYQKIKSAEARGHPLVWDGAGKGILQLNLVPHAVTGTDFGCGIPVFAILLSRNSSGLRLSLTPDASCFLIEACLPDGHGDSLVETCRVAGLHPAVWCRGPDLSETVCK
jgi:hypothetical protein